MNQLSMKTKKMKDRKIAYVTGTRAEYGLMISVLRAIKKSKKLKLQLYYTGMHLMEHFGCTGRIVQCDFPDAQTIEALFESDNQSAVPQFMGTLMHQLTTAFSMNRPDLVLTLGDRPEMLCVATVSAYLGIPTGHIHGGDRTSTIDEITRHAITKLSHLHFPATREAALRIKKMGEEPWRIHTVGAPALDFIQQEKLLTKNELYDFLNLDKKNRFLLVTQHPVSEAVDQSGFQMKQTIDAVKFFNLPVVIIYPNADPGNQEMRRVIDEEKQSPLFRIYPSLEYKIFLSVQKEAAVWVGNSSAAMIESASFNTPVVNIGERQSDRIHGNNVINVDYNKKEIIQAIKKSLYDIKYLKNLKKIKNPWGDGNAGKRIVNILTEIMIDKKLLHKKITY